MGYRPPNAEPRLSAGGSGLARPTGVSGPERKWPASARCGLLAVCWHFAITAVPSVLFPVREGIVPRRERIKLSSVEFGWSGSARLRFHRESGTRRHLGRQESRKVVVGDLDLGGILQSRRFS